MAHKGFSGTIDESMVGLITKGLLIGIEGIDAVGKGTQSSLLRASFQSGKYDSKIIAFPDYSTTIGEEIKAFLSRKRTYPAQVRHMLFAANRWEHNQELEGWLGQGLTLIVNRYSESNIVYGVANKLPLDWLLNLEEGLPKTNLVIVLDAQPSAVSSRRMAERKDEFESNNKLQEDVGAIYRSLSSKFGWTIVNAERRIGEVHKSIIELVNHKFSLNLRPIDADSLR
jgi:dTMP kinase